jgi:hypothetical protein
MPRRCRLLLLPILILGAAAAPAQDLEELLTEVGQPYAEAYTEPLVHGFGADQNAGLYTTAHIPAGRFTFSVGVRVMGTYLAEEDQSFTRVLEDVELDDYLDLQPGDPGYGETGDIVLEGPTMFGSPDEVGTATAYVNGAPVYQVEGIEGLVDTRWVPLFAPEATVGGFFGLRGTIRWLPEIELSDVGKTKYLGLGLQWSPNFLLPPDFPVDLMGGFFVQEIDVGTILQTDASSVFAAASRRFGLATLYGGVAWESSSMKVEYVEEETGEEVSFEKDGKMSGRFTLGTTLNLGVKLNLEMGIGNMVAYTAGIMFGM